MYSNKIEYLNAPSSECTLKRILHVNNIETTNVLLTVNNDSRTTHVTTAGDHDDVASIKLDEIGDLVLLKVEFDSVVDLDGRIGIADGATVMRDNERNTLGTNGDLADLEEFVGGLLGGDAVDGEAALDVVEETEVLARLLDRNDI